MYVGNVAMLNCAKKDCRYKTVYFILHVASESLMHISKLQRILTEMLFLQFYLTQHVLPVIITFSISLYKGQRPGNRAILGSILFSLQFLPNFKKVQNVSWL
jgi:hypothetical protein